MRLRFYPFVPQNYKYDIKDDTLPNVTFAPRGTTITYSIYWVQRLESIWGVNCLEFKLERCIKNGMFEPPHDSYMFVAFNGGPRIYLGKDLTYLQMKYIVVGILPHHRIYCFWVFLIPSTKNAFCVLIFWNLPRKSWC